MERLDRWTYDPILRNGKPVAAELQTRDLDLFELLDPNRYRYLPSNFVHAFQGGDLSSLGKRLELLTREPNRYLNRPDRQRNRPKSHCRHLIYERNDRAALVLHDEERLKELRAPAYAYRGELPHALMIDTTFASIDLSVRKDPTARFIYPDEILASQRFPESSLKRRAKGKNPLAIPLTVSHYFPNRDKTETLSYDYTNDGLRGIEYTLPDGKKAYRFLNLEAERAKRIDAYAFRNSKGEIINSFLKTYLSVKAVTDNEMFLKWWGIPNLTTLVVTSKQIHIDNMKKLILKLDLDGCEYVCFQEVPDLEDAHRTFEPLPQLFSGPWQRAGHPDFYINEP